MYALSAPLANADNVAKYPQHPPIVSIIKTRLLVPVADCLILSIIRHISLIAVSLPNDNDVPGILLLIVHGITHNGIHNDAYVSRALCNSRHE